MGWRVLESVCPICRGADRKVIGSRGGPAHRNGHGVMTTVVRCRAYGCFYASPTLVPDSNPYVLETADAYFHAHDPARKRQTSHDLAAFAESVLRRKGRMLEVGCGRGELLEGARARGWAVFGIEMTPEFAAIAETAGITVERPPVETAELLRAHYDVILFAAILEHLYDPLGVLRRARRALPQGGLIFVDVPNEASLAMSLGNLYMRATGRAWAVNLSPTCPPFHVVGFTAACLRGALALAGFRVLVLRKPRGANVAPAPRTVREFIENAGLTAASRLGRCIGMGDGLRCWAAAV